MAYVAGVSSSQEPAVTTTFLMSNPGDVQVGDLLVAMCSRDNTGTAITSNWTIPASGEITAGSIRMACAYHRVTALPVTPCTFTGASEEWAGCVYIIRDYYYDSADSDCIDIVGSNNDATLPYTMTGLNVNYANSLILIAVGVDGAVNPVPAGGNIVVEDAQDAGTVSFLSGWSVEPTDGATDSIDFIGTTTTNTLVFLKFAIRNATGGRVPVVPGATIHDVIDTGYHRERSAAYTNETTTANFLGWDVRDPDYVYQDDGGVFTDLTTAATNDTDADVAFPTTEAINDAIYIGDAAQFSSLVVDRAGCTNGAAGVFAVEYYNGSAWVAVSKKLDLTTNFTATVGDNQVINWRTPANQATTTVNSVSAYWIRLRITTVYTTNPTVSRIRVAEAGLVYDAYGAVADTGVNAFWSTSAVSPANTYIGCHTGAIRDLGTTLDLNVAERYLVGTYQFTSPREYYDSGAADLGYGVRLPLLDSSNNYKSWVVGGFAYPQCAGDKRVTWAIQPSQSTDTSHSVSGIAPDFNNTRKWVISQGSYADEVTNIYHSYMAFANRAIIQGGNNANWSDIKRAINGTLFPYYNAGQLYIPVQFGGGKACNVDCNLATFDFVKVAGSKYGGMIHVDTGILGVIIKASSGDSVKIRNSTITSESLIRFEVDAASSALATYDFSGTTVVNATVTLRSVASFNGMNFINCPTFTQNGALMDGCNLSDTKVTSATLGAMEDITNCAFTSSGTGHAIEVGGTAADIALVGNTFTGYAGSDGSTGNEAIYVNIASGTVNINISGGDTPSIRTAGAMVNVISGATVTFTGLPTGCDIVILTAGTSTILQQVDAHGSTSYAWGYSGTPTVDVGFIKPGYVPFYIRGLALGAADSSIPVSLTPDRNYA
ncbi:MAG: hypothetical protein MUE63_00210 [Xanthomonadales bacterium]|jgi:hypothetical protein|nr:hypothetical protein [Xanthomonadales bacterium]